MPRLIGKEREEAPLEGIFVFEQLGKGCHFRCVPVGADIAVFRFGRGPVANPEVHGGLELGLG